ncbi:DUF5320 domain-containing protein [Methanoplanus limicola]|uniref:Uncharacterized protein n=1 Tax=Methanoplanus limicola DSM 2279 TaxID=937775 RepID=H1Z1W6_9EURY|nr:DUF5320 domain-containing protein [Methanoplanus limicola]EHQ35433.1 hypothetical protein Metlim_1324 [Methanoplanus limicola DSM 2279]
MPGFDRTGPQGRGPMTGRGMGQCRSENISGATAQADTEGETANIGVIRTPGNVPPAGNIVYGAGRGGVPRGCGMGFCGGRGGRGRGRGRF